MSSDSLSVLVIDEESEILSFFARILDASGIRALLAHNADEAIGIARRGYVPIDLILTDVFLKPDAVADESGGAGLSGPELVERLRAWRPQVRALYMSAYLDAGVIRIELMDMELRKRSRSSGDRGLIEAIRVAATTPLVAAMGGLNPQ